MNNPSLPTLHAERAVGDLPALTSLVAALEARDYYTCGHAARVSALAVRLGRVVGLGPVDLELLRTAGMLHDVGKIGVSDAVLYKDGPLAPHEKLQMDRHPIIGAEIIAPVLPLIIPAVLHHHERYDGRGYPSRLENSAIPLAARILAVCDTYDAMTSARPYREARSHIAALGVLDRGRGTQWDADLVDLFIGLVAPSCEAAPPAILRSSLSQTLPLRRPSSVPVTS